MEIDIVGSSFLMVRLFPHENPISRFIRTYGWINGLLQVVSVEEQSRAAHDSHGSCTGYAWNESFLTLIVLGKRLTHSDPVPVATLLSQSATGHVH